MAFEQFLPDYFAECEQHLASARAVLLELDELPPGAVLGAARVQQLFRALHTLKGLSGMVGLVSAERVAHALEDLLRPWRSAGGPLDRIPLQDLFAGIALMEACIGAKRDRTAPPATEPFLKAIATPSGAAGTDFASLTATAGAGASAGGISQPGTEARASGAAQPAAETLTPAAPAAGRRYRLEFRPSTQLATRGVGVEAIRARLNRWGQVRSALPRVEPGGAIAFEFLVDVAPGTEPEAVWREDGLSWTLDAEHNGSADDLASATPQMNGVSAEAVPGVRGGDAAPSARAESARLALGSVLRVDVARVDELMRMIGELVLGRARLVEALRQLPGPRTGAAWEAVQESTTLLERQLRALREGVMRVRLVQVGQLFERLRFALRELARESGRLVRLEVSGQQTEIDKVVVERMLEPLLHLVRNAVSHGIEAPEERVARGKPAEGRLLLAAVAAGDRITITVEDDGAGIDRARVAARAVEHGLLTPGADLDAGALLDLLARPGFSTRERPDLASGRGVGLAVVRTTVRELGGELTLETDPGQGTRFRIELPLTLMIVDALLVELGGQVMAVPQPALREVFQLEPRGIAPVGRHELVPYRGGVLPLLRLRHLLNLQPSEAATGAVLVVGSPPQLVGLVVDRLLGLREIVVHPLTDPLVVLRGISGATELGDGRVALVLDASALIQAAREEAEESAADGPLSLHAPGAEGVRT